MNTEKIKVTKCFDCNHPLWLNNKEHNRLSVNTILNHCYDKFRCQRYLFLNDVYQELGIAKTKQGQMAGWVYDGQFSKDCMWTVWTKNDEYDDVYITFEPLNCILDALPNEAEEG